MRFVVLLLGIIGVVMTGAVAWFFIENSLGQILDAYAPDGQKELALSLTISPLDTPHVDTGMFMLIAAGYGLFGVMLAFGRCGWQGGLLMIVPALTVAIMNPCTLAFSGLQVFAGLLAFFVFPLPLALPAAVVNEDDDDEPRAKAKAAPKRKTLDEDDYVG